MKVAILAGGLGTRLSEETTIRPKPMVEIGGKPILWHIMMYYSSFGFYEFAIALGYKGEHIKRWMLEHDRLSKNLTNKANIDKIIFNGESKRNEPDWKVDLVDTGQETNTGAELSA